MRVGQKMPENETFHYIVVGAGSAGAALANRLSAERKNRVLLLEAGQASHRWGSIPAGYAKMLKDPTANWCYDSTPEEGTGNRALPAPRGKLLGGSSAINGLVFVRGQAQDYDTWAQMGNRGWSYQDVLPVFKRLENYEGGADEFRGDSGPLRVTNPDESGPLYDAIIKAAGEAGVPHNRDYNGPSQEGISMSQATIANGKRMSTAACYLDPIRDRDNLKIQTGALSESLILEGKRCVGVRYSVNGEQREMRAEGEVIISCGSFNSPQLLELSGIGQPERLKALGIEIQRALPGVGENLRDHFAPRTRWAINAKGYTYNDRGRGLGLFAQAMKYALQKKGMLSIPAAPLRAFVKSREGLEAPDLLLGWVPMLYEINAKGAPKLSKQSGLTCYAHVMRPESKGSVHIKEACPGVQPDIRYNFLSSPPDQDLTVQAIRTARAIMTAPAMAELGVTELLPGSGETSDDAILAWARAFGETTYHPVGTCKMGSDRMAVVDDKLRVHGIDGLRIADASIMPTLISGNTNAPSIMIGEKASDLVLQDTR